jgi:hypothetical protein
MQHPSPTTFTEALSELTTLFVLVRRERCPRRRREAGERITQATVAVWAAIEQHHQEETPYATRPE